MSRGGEGEGECKIRGRCEGQMRYLFGLSERGVQGRRIYVREVLCKGGQGVYRYKKRTKFRVEWTVVEVFRKDL